MRTLQTHGYASRVQFRLACTKIPKDVLLLEIGPHALMRSPLRQNRCRSPCQVKPALSDSCPSGKPLHS